MLKGGKLQAVAAVKADAAAEQQAKQAKQALAVAKAAAASTHNPYANGIGHMRIIKAVHQVP
jgi:hypothetical protein